MENRKVTVLDLNGCKSLDELHERLSITFDFPDWYGRNWDAFWDLLNMEVPEELTNVEITGLTKLPADLKDCGEMMIKIMQENKEDHEESGRTIPNYDYRFDYKIID